MSDGFLVLLALFLSFDLFIISYLGVLITWGFRLPGSHFSLCFSLSGPFFLFPEICRFLESCFEHGIDHQMTVTKTSFKRLSILKSKLFVGQYQVNQRTYTLKSMHVLSSNYKPTTVQEVFQSYITWLNTKGLKSPMII